MKNFVRDGKHIPVKAPRKVKSGEGILIEDLFGVCIHSGEEGERVTLAVEGVYRLPKDPSVVISLGESAYFSSVTGKITNSETEMVSEENPSDENNPREVEKQNIKIGVFIRAEAISSTECEVKLR